MDIGEIGWFGIDWIDLALERYQCAVLAIVVMNLWGP
jgi:hypothetical protein